MRIIVSRGLGDNPSPDVLVDSLLFSEAVATEKGKAYLYDNGFDQLDYTLHTKIPRDIKCGDILQFFDPDYGNEIKGRVVSWSNSCEMDNQGNLSFSQTIEINTYIL